jgi:hypothetical protein
LSKEIKLTKGYVAIVDDEDYERLNKYKWRAETTGRFIKNVYAVRTDYRGGKHTRRLHMYIVVSTEDIDHRNNNTLDNRRSNLRATTRIGNNTNQRKTGKKTTSKYKGVSFCTTRGLWASGIRSNNKSKTLGYFSQEIDAAKAYNAAALKYFGEFARLNVIEEEIKIENTYPRQSAHV